MCHDRAPSDPCMLAAFLTSRMASGFVIKCCVSIVAKSGSNRAACGAAGADSAADSAADTVAGPAADIVAHSLNDTAAHNTTAAASCNSPCDTRATSPGVIGRLFTFPQPLLRHVSWDDLAEDDFIAVPLSHSVTVSSKPLPKRIPYSLHATNPCRAHIPPASGARHHLRQRNPVVRPRPCSALRWRLCTA